MVFSKKPKKQTPPKFTFCSFDFSLLGSYSKFYLSLLFVPFVFHYWTVILGLSKFILCPIGFSPLGHHPKFLSMFILCTFNFLKLRHHPRFHLCLLFVPLASHYWDFILGFIHACLFFALLASHHWVVILGSKFIL